MWTPQERNEWVQYAKTTELQKDNRRGYTFYKMKKNINASDNEDIKRTFVTSCLSKAIYNSTNPYTKRLAYCFYKLLMQKVCNNSFLYSMYKKNLFIIIVKGSNAYKLLLKNLATDIEYSDLDIVVFINPNIEDTLYSSIHSSLIILISQALSKYKKDLDALLFNNVSNVDAITILNKDTIEQFKTDYKALLSEYNLDNGIFISPFENEQLRNECSRRSFIIEETDADETVVKIEIPHMNMCECIPLKKSPLVLSYNNTISFNRDLDGLHKGSFELLRLRLNNLYCTNGVTSDFKVVPSDFIDVSIPAKDDAVSIDFWNTNAFRRCYEVYDKFVDTYIMIPNLNQCIQDLSNILYVYNNGQVKIEKRQKRLELFMKLDKMRKDNI